MASIMGLGQTSLAQSGGRNQAVIVFMGGVSLSDWLAADAPNLHALIEQGSIGIMNARPAGSFTPGGAYATLGASDRAYSSLEAGYSLEGSEIYKGDPAREVFHRRTGVDAPAQAVFELDLARLIKNNTRFETAPRLGAVGQALADQGRIVAVAGNADTNLERGREFVMAFMNERGFVPLGYVGDGMNSPNPLKPFGLATNYDELYRAVGLELKQADCIAIELGDTARVDKAADSLMPWQRKKLRLAAIAGADSFLGRLRQALDLERTALFVVSPYPSRDSVDAGDTLPPVLAIGQKFGPGVVYSASTRRMGIISVFDLQAAFMDAVGIRNTPGFQGRPLSSQVKADAVAFLQTESDRIVRVNVTRTPLLKGFVVVQIILLILAVLLVLARPRKRALYRLLRAALVGVTVIPLAMLILPLFGLPGLTGGVLYLVLAAVLGGLLAMLEKDSSVKVPGIIALVTTAAVTADTFFRSPLMKESLLGYSPIGGARYYGIGNEYMGVVLGASVIGAVVAFDWLKNRRLGLPLAALLFAVSTYCVAMPWLGSNVGGAISLAVTYAITLLLLGSRQLPKVRTILLALGAAALLVIVLAALDFARGAGSQSHLGRLVANIMANGPSAIWPIITRKVSMNLMLIENTIWTRVLVTFMGVIAVLFYRPRGKLAEIASRYPALARGLWGASIGSFVALVVNDSGIVAAATAMLYPVAALTAVVLGDMERAPAESHARHKK